MNPPLTFIINVMNVLGIMNNTTNTMIPINIGVVLSGSIMSQFYTKSIANKYTNGNEKYVKLGDILFHWLPMITLICVNKKKVNNKNIIASFLLPILYFSFKFEKKTMLLTNPIKHMQSIYPDIPLWVFMLYLTNPYALKLKKYYNKCCLQN